MSDSMRAVGSSGLGPGTVLDGKYEILNRIGAGGMGEVFKARHLHLNAFRCIKVMKQELLADDLFRSRFLREARLATQIHHPNIAVVHDFFVGDGGNYMVTEFIEGRTLRQWSAQHGPFPLPLAADVATQVLMGLDHIHRRGLLHRDISPDNVMLSFDPDDRCIAKIIDLGIAKDLASGASADTTQAGVLIGNPKYMSPEQLGLLNEGEQIDGRTDLYSLGVVLYEMLLGVPPFASESSHGYIMKHLTQPPRRFREAQPRVSLPDAIESVILRMLEKNRVHRFANARELASALAPFLEAAAGTLSREDVERLHRPPDFSTVTQQVPIPVLAPEDQTVAETTTAKARAAEAELAFQKAWEDGRTSAWQAFLDTYGNSDRAKEARKLLDEAAAFEEAYRSDTETAVRGFLSAWPDARHHLEAGILLAKLKQRNAEQRAFEDARARNTKSSWDLYLTAYPNGAHADEARAQIAELAKAAIAARAQKEPADFDAAWERGTSAVWDKFLAEHPESPRLAEARNCRQEALDFELATATNTAAMWRAFIKTWPAGRHRIEAEIRLESGR